MPVDAVEYESFRPAMPERSAPERSVSCRRRAALASLRASAERTPRIEAGLTPEERATLDTFRDHYGVANQLLQLRLERGISQTELSEPTGIAQAEISKIERGVVEPRTGPGLLAKIDEPTLDRFADLFERLNALLQ